MKFLNKNTVYWLAAVGLMTLSAALAQQAPKPPAKPTAPGLRPVAVENGEQVLSPSSQIEVPQQTTATYAGWVVQCQTQAGPPPQKICDMAQVTQVQGKGVPFSRVAIAHPVKGQPVKLVVQVPVNASFATSVNIQTSDDDPGFIAPFARCLPAGCFADFELKEDILKKLRAASGVGKLTFADAGGHNISVPLSFNGFGQALDALARE